MIKNIVAAFQFLMIVPVPVKTSTRNLELSLPWFPLVGGVIGLGTGFAYRGWVLLFPLGVAAALTIGVYIILTRGLHLDGYMDTIDGFFSGRDRERILDIMKEPTVGSFAVLGMGIWFLTVWGGIPMLSPADHVMVHALTRFQVLLPALFFSYPRESGTGKFFVEHVHASTIIQALVVLLVIAGGVYGLDVAGRGRFVVYGVCGMVSVLSALATGFWARRKIGGVTGDVLGFAIEIAHAGLILIIIASK